MWMDGSNRRVIVSKSNSLKWPNGVAYDPGSNRIYWAESWYEYIGSCDIDGRQLRRFRNGSFIKIPYGIIVHGQYVYFTEWNLRSVIRANKTNGGQMTSLHSYSDSQANKPMMMVLFSRLMSSCE